MNGTGPIRLKTSPLARFQGVIALAACALLVGLGPFVRAQGDPSELLLSLALKANEGNEEKARALADRLLSAMPARVDPSFSLEVEKAGPGESARLLAMIILRSEVADFRNDGMALLEKAVEATSVDATEALAVILLEGRHGQARNPNRAVELLRRARQMPGAKTAHRLLGDLALKGEGMAKDTALAVEYYLRGAEAGSVDCLLALHRLYRDEDGGAYDPIAAERQGLAAVEAGNAEAAYEMGIFYEEYVEGAPNWSRASEWLKKGLEKGYGPAARRLADYAFEGRLGRIDAAEGTRLLREAAGFGDGEACLRLATFYEKGEVLPQDPVASTAWIRIAASMGYGLAENAYGLRLVNGYGVASDPAEASRWFAKAAAQGLADGQVNLALLLENGIGVAPNPEEARRLFLVAAEAGQGVAQERLARLFSEGADTAARDPLEAAYWATQAERSGVKGAAALSSKLRGALTAAQLSELDRRRPAAAPSQP
jgi:TPR repeat protein